MIIFQDSLINKKVKRTVFIQNKNKNSICTIIQKFGFSFFFLSNTFIQEECVKWIKGDSKYLYCEKSFLF